MEVRESAHNVDVMTYDSNVQTDIDELVSMHQQGLLTDEELAATKALLAEQSRRIAAQ